jgi:DNA-binding MurR/RpiR family transcriptional regulator
VVDDRHGAILAGGRAARPVRRAPIVAVVDRPPARVDELIRSHLDRLSPAERRVAELVVADPDAIAFGTVASVAAAAETSGPTVVRFAARLGLPGFVALQAAVRAERSATEVRATQRLDAEVGPGAEGFAGSLAAAVRSLEGLLSSVPSSDVDAAATLLADPKRSVVVLAAAASAGIGTQVAASLDLLRPGVRSATGDPLAVGIAVAHLEPGDVVVALDFPRYERWLLDALDAAREAGAEVVGVSASALSPIATAATVALSVPVVESGPFDSQVGALALLEALVAEVAARRRRPAARRIATVEAAWDRLDLLAPEDGAEP